MARKVTVGTGITAHEVAILGTGGELKASARRHNDTLAANGHFGLVSAIAEATCRRILAENPTEWAGEDTPQDFAHRIMASIDAARGEVSKGDADRASRHAFNAGRDWALFCMKQSWEPAAMTGAKVRHEGENDLKGGRPPKTLARDMGLAEEFSRLRPTSRRSDSALKADIGKRAGLKRSTSIVAIDRGLKKLSEKAG